MSVNLQRLGQAEVPEIATTLRNAGIAGAGGAGFPTHAKWERLDEVSFLLVNHQESEPVYYIDKWLGKTHTEDLASLFDALLEETLELIVICAKETNQAQWMGELEAALDGTVYTAEQLPIDPADESGVVFAYTDDRYEYGMESVLLRLVADVVLQNELPMDHGWIVQNTETMFNIFHALDKGETVTRKFVHVDGNVPRHRFLEVPVGTPATTLLDAAGRKSAELDDDETLADGGPGWCFEVEGPPSEFGVSKRTNCVLVLDKDVVAENTLGNGRVNVLSAYDWSGDHETEPTPVEPDVVRIPLITNPSFGDIVAKSHPIVEEGTEVTEGAMIAVPGQDGISNSQHASIDGTVTAVTETHIEIRRNSSGERSAGDVLAHERMVYWTWCKECGAYIARPEWDQLGPGTEYVCKDCR
ncbi:NADH dehydrogenase subunit (plasmid) [Haloferax mediterranei ATCC 33500]|uniref:NADH dehydrogenase n=1 Tax=Haloferax mediterranei (strain ATCC 33500 / DSM 1411 / JCM 8866 / NBRC 14739 / NCIMB 2177 / R-4) TaxID=523841 RepID=I3RA91_HALMT|nr:NADH dehydrogenase [Haloferax mediterranei]AFK21151.1 Respiratory-chain NADH dehydrogenase 51 Kd subunit [Haloferax mediterranei ATCC 33500]AHZ24329.1 NADH dehydrogenase [Haloferax mediterranei ATCC 33500]ELZ97060.1 Respiratory-chain NADH dehydrogenase 51 Kd subunit [Haloferax mediterranei ATCC 33500]MDX5990194.1 NADH dehydrogenase subunit [Haloferax mediterranei ATCC 33500]QCQ76735.1 NADH dehydrogenase subunit [Haloferax mediterranei ATCC 33500]